MVLDVQLDRGHGPVLFWRGAQCNRGSKEWWCHSGTFRIKQRLTLRSLGSNIVCCGSWVGFTRMLPQFFWFFLKRFVSRMPVPARANYYTSSLPVIRRTPWTRARRGLLTGGDLSHLWKQVLLHPAVQQPTNVQKLSTFLQGDGSFVPFVPHSSSLYSMSEEDIDRVLEPVRKQCRRMVSTKSSVSQQKVTLSTKSKVSKTTRFQKGMQPADFRTLLSTQGNTPESS